MPPASVIGVACATSLFGSRSAPSSGGSTPMRKHPARIRPSGRRRRAARSPPRPRRCRRRRCAAAARRSWRRAPRRTAPCPPNTFSDGATSCAGASSRRRVARPSLAGTPASDRLSQSSSCLRPKKPLASPLAPLDSWIGVACATSSLGSRSSLPAPLPSSAPSARRDALASPLARARLVHAQVIGVRRHRRRRWGSPPARPARRR